MELAERVLRLSDLASCELPARPLAVLGDPVSHSLSPAMHNAALRAMAKEDPSLETWGYLRIELPVEELEGALPRLHALGFCGLNLTLPHKVRAVELVETIDPVAGQMGAVNTLIRTSTGYRGSNTDGYGIARAVERAFSCVLGAAPVILCGAGGAARAIAVESLRSGVRELWIGNRSRENLDRLLEQLAKAGLGEGRVHPFLFEELPAGLPSEALLINATAAGLSAGDSLPLDLAFLRPGSLIMDTTYGVENAWARYAGERGFAYSDGLNMLVHQGVRSLEIWSERTVPAEVMEVAARSALEERRKS